MISLLLLTAGPIHDATGIGDIVQRYLEEDGRYRVVRVQDDLDAFLPERIAEFQVIVFYNTLGELTDAQRNGLLGWIKAGHGFVTFHSGADSFRDDPAYRDMVGGYFITHPHYRTYQVSVKDPEHPITQGIDEFMITDEQYVLSYDQRNQVLATSLYKGDIMPVLWVKPYGKGRVHYNALGHDPAAVEQEMFRTLFLRGVAWAAGL